MFTIFSRPPFAVRLKRMSHFDIRSVDIEFDILSDLTYHHYLLCNSFYPNCVSIQNQLYPLPFE